MIIKGIIYIGKISMDWIDSLDNLVSVAGVMGTVTILLVMAMIFLITSFSKQMKAQSDATKTLATAIGILTDKVSSPYMDVERSLDIFRAIMRDHIWHKLDLIGEILEKNNIHQREDQIKQTIKLEFKSITKRESERLSKYKSVCGDMGKVLQEEVDWNKLLKPIYGHVFSDIPDKQKINYIHAELNGAVDTIATIIENNGIYN